MSKRKSQSKLSLTSEAAARPSAHAAAREGDASAVDELLIPPLVKRGESLEDDSFPDCGERYQVSSKNGRPLLIAHPLPKPDGVSYSAITDYLNCSFPFNPKDIAIFFSQLLACLGEQFAPATDRSRPLHFYPTSFSLGNSSGVFAYGGQGGTGLLSLPGEACHLVPNWNTLITLIKDKLGGRITRWDGAVDDYAGIHNVDWAVQLYKEGKFNAGGNEPSCDQRGNWIKPDGKGRTFYVGKRENGKLLRVYEKGMQLGKLYDPWVRWEVELHNTGRIIPFDVLLEPGKYVAGAYPKTLGWIQEEMQRIRTIIKTGKISYGALTDHAARAYGKHVNAMMAVEGSAEKVVEKLRRDGIPSRLDTPSLAVFRK